MQSYDHVFPSQLFQQQTTGMKTHYEFPPKSVTACNQKLRCITPPSSVSWENSWLVGRQLVLYSL